MRMIFICIHELGVDEIMKDVFADLNKYEILL